MTRLKKDGTPAKKPGRKPNPNKEIKQTRSRKGPRPHVWRCGPDEYKHSMYLPWMRAKAQANFRNEGWEMSFDEFYELWKNDWPKRGRQPEDMCMTRDDYDGPWVIGNVTIVTRAEHLKKQKDNRSDPNYRGPKGGRPRKAIQLAKVKK